MNYCDLKLKLEKQQAIYKCDLIIFACSYRCSTNVMKALTKLILFT